MDDPCELDGRLNSRIVVENHSFDAKVLLNGIEKEFIDIIISILL